MFLTVSRIKKSLRVASPILLHVFMILAVAAYTLFGAYVMHRLENGAIHRINEQNGYSHAPNTETAIVTRKRRALQEDPSQIVLTGNELAAIAPGIHLCVKEALFSVMNMTECESRSDWIGQVFFQIGQELDKVSITKIDECYRNAHLIITNLTIPGFRHNNAGRANESGMAREQASTSDNGQGSPYHQQSAHAGEGWTFPNAVIFAFTLITTIGYGHIAPVTWQGQLFCIAFGFVGIPLALLTVADIGMFLNKVVKTMAKWMQAGMRRVLRRQKQTEGRERVTRVNSEEGNAEGVEDEESEQGADERTVSAMRSGEL